jgi:hypothetical protein
MKNIFIIMFIATAFSIFLFACEKKTIDLGSYDQPYNPATVDSVRFNTHIIPIFETSCLSCHGESGNPPNLSSNVAYSNITATPGQYINLSAPPSSFLYTYITETPNTHGGGTYATEGEQILKWIQQGAKNN